MEKDVTLDPVDVGLLSSDALMLHPEHVSNLVEEFGARAGFYHRNPALSRTSADEYMLGAFRSTYRPNRYRDEFKKRVSG
jgi:hypothetical protein